MQYILTTRPHLDFSVIETAGHCPSLLTTHSFYLSIHGDPYSILSSKDRRKVTKYFRFFPYATRRDSPRDVRKNRNLGIGSPSNTDGCSVAAPMSIVTP